MFSCAHGGEGTVVKKRHRRTKAEMEQAAAEAAAAVSAVGAEPTAMDMGMQNCELNDEDGDLLETITSLRGNNCSPSFRDEPVLEGQAEVKTSEVVAAAEEPKVVVRPRPRSLSALADVAASATPSPSRGPVKADGFSREIMSHTDSVDSITTRIGIADA